MQIGHLARRFFGSLRPGGPPPDDEAWARAQLLPGEIELWARMPGADRRHAVGVARQVGEDRPERAAALLHDVGKIDSGYGTFGRVVATLVGRTRARGRMARYYDHPRIGAAWLEKAGSDPLTVAWTREHHLPEARWTVPLDAGRRLKAADDD